VTPALLPAWRGLPRRVVLGGCAGALLLGAAAAPWVDDAGDTVLLLRAAEVLLAATMAFALDDAADTLLASSPTSLRRRAARTLGLCGAVVAATWAVLVLGAVALADGSAVPGLTVELAALSALAVAVAGGLRVWRGLAEPGALAAPVVLAVLVAAAALPPQLDMLHPSPDWPGWDGAVARWAVLAAVMTAGVVRTTRDPAAR
jgi:hypothetical protein